MDLNLLHLYMELTAVACLFFIAGINLHYNATGEYSKLMALGISIAAVTDLTHALVPAFYPDIAEHWMMLSWGASRITIIIMFFMIFLCYDVINCKLKNMAIILATPLIFSIFMAASIILDNGDFHQIPHPIYVFGVTIHCPADFGLLIMWLITAIVLRKKAHILFPPHVYWLFMSQGIMVHAIMSFTSVSSLDLPSLMAHALKISEYYSFILIYLLYKSTLDRRSDKFRTNITKSINTKDDALCTLEPTKGNK